MEIRRNTEAEIQPGTKGIFQIMRERRDASPRYFGKVKEPANQQQVAAE